MLISKRILPAAFIIVLIAALFPSCKNTPQTPADYVDPFIGTGGHGHTFPGATLPFGMVQLSPDTRKDSWDGCSGYHYSDDFLLGFSHMHLSGTGVGDYGDIRFVPLSGELKFKPGSPENPDSGYGAKFSHKNETAEAGYYSVNLDNGIDVEITASERAGFHSYCYPNNTDKHILIDLIESVVTEKIIAAEINIISETEILGYRRTNAWANDQIVYFYAVFNQPFSSSGIVIDGKYWQNRKIAVGDSLIAVLNFDNKNDKPIMAKVGISSVDYNGAMSNCKDEIDHWDFNKTRTEAKNKWNERLEKIIVESNNEDAKTIFYTALYHSMVAPNLYSDVDHRYRSHGKEICKDDSFEMHTVFSLWDTFRALHPLFTIIEQQKTNDLINSMLDMYKHDGLLPVWELSGNETNCMIGYNSVPVITDAWIKGIREYDAHLALKAMVETATADQFGLKYYKTKGYIPADKEGESVSKTLEYAYDDWCIAELAKGLDDQKVYEEFTKRAQYYKNIYDASTGFFRGKSNGCFITPFDPTQVNFMLTEANTWQYNFFVPQDINTHIELLGGDEGYEAKLDTLFKTTIGLSGRHQSDITGLIGQYAHGNEPSHHMAYLYNYVGAPWKLQEIINKICSELYTVEPDGLSGNEDCGQMSAWYVLSAMGFYPVTPGRDIYVLGTPVFDELTINLENGNAFVIKAEREHLGDFYVQSVKYNGIDYTPSYITHEMIMRGGELIFKLSGKPNKDYGKFESDRPKQKIADFQITPVPYFVAPSKTFIDKIEISAGDINESSAISITSDKKRFKYSEPFEIEKTTTLTAVSESNGILSFMEEASFVKIPEGRSITVNAKYSDQYTAGGDVALINSIRGGDNFRTGNWQGYYGVDLDVVIDLGKMTKVSKAGIGFLQEEYSWIFMPQWVTFEGSKDGQNFTLLGKVENTINPREGGGIIEDFELTGLNASIKYLKVKAKSLEICPDWHNGASKPCWIFADEIWVE